LSFNGFTLPCASLRNRKPSSTWDGPTLACNFSRSEAFPQLVAPSGSDRSGGGGNETVEAFETTGRLGRLGEPAGRNDRERRASPETSRCGSRPGCYTGKAA